MQPESKYLLRFWRDKYGENYIQNVYIAINLYISINNVYYGWSIHDTGAFVMPRRFAVIQYGIDYKIVLPFIGSDINASHVSNV